jgi:DNA-binding beta-propeller fold protein YncE
VSEVDATTNQVLATFDVGSTARNIKIFGNYAYVTSAENNRLTIIDTNLTQDVVTIDNVGLNGPIGVGVVGDRVDVANAGGNTVTVVNFKPTLVAQEV